MKSMSMQGLGSLQLKLLSNKVHLHHIRFVGLFLFFSLKQTWCEDKRSCSMCSSVYWVLYDKSLFLFRNSEMASSYPSFSVLCSWFLRGWEPQFCLTLLVLFVVAYIYHLHLFLIVRYLIVSITVC